ncbi:MAG: tRNA (adenosine(37)-N6)-threonylcarbamoyltransferase complex dimerization subunit type 1 TsaB [Thermodesulfobacteriota bacterium]|nr:tRNA (adenosine(37)-N6)-threonylcarbamoyltransferase complex dimerization subunit type 1 TsaB [Thermodesulfobacteriota bacterium]
MNTTTLDFSLSLMGEEGTVLAEYTLSKSRGHFGSLMPALDFLLSTSRVRIHDLKCLVVATGPGSFTGLRIGLSTAKGLSHSLGLVPLIGVSSLEAMACQVPYSEKTIVPMLDSRRGEVFTASFAYQDNGMLTRKSEDMAVRLDEFPDGSEDSSIFIGNDFVTQSAILKSSLGDNVPLAPAWMWNLRASSIGSLGLVRYHADDFDDVESIKPVYLRPPDIRHNPVPLISPQKLSSEA